MVVRGDRYIIEGMGASRGLTLVELMITLVITITLMALGLITMTGYLPKQRLLASQSLLEGLFQRAQMEAQAKSFWTCVRFAGNPIVAELFLDNDPVNIDHGNNPCGTHGARITEARLKTYVGLASCSGTAVTASHVVWFDTTGSPRLCPPNGSAPGAPAAAPCIPPVSALSLILFTDKLASGARAREIELMAGGLIHIPKPAEKGLDTNLWAKIPPNETGAGACE